MKTVKLILAIFAITFFFACGDDDDKATGDTGGRSDTCATCDTQEGEGSDAGDTSKEDDAGTSEDAETAQDTLEDSGNTEEDAGAEDTGVEDTGTEDTGDAASDELKWEHFEVEIKDDVIKGSYVWIPIDGVSFAYDVEKKTFFTSYYRDGGMMWLVDEAAKTHSKQKVSGDVFATTVDFCGTDESDWCQFLGFDPVSRNYLIFGPQTDSILSVDEQFNGTMKEIQGEKPRQALNNNHLYVWSERKLYHYGSVSASGPFGNKLSAFDIDTATWSPVASGLTPILGNCLAYDSKRKLLYSFGGERSEDGNETETLATYSVIDPATGKEEIADLPPDMGTRSLMSCAYDSTRDAMFLFGGALIELAYADEPNTYHNDLWMFDIESGEWAQLIAESEGGTWEEGYDPTLGKEFVGDPNGPNFGKNGSKMIYDEANDRLVIIGEVPGSSAQMYFLKLSALE